MKNNMWKLFTALKNGQLAKQNYIYCENNKISKAFLKLLWDNGFIIGYKIDLKNSNHLIIYLKYINNKPVIKLIKIMSTSTKRFYCSINQIHKINSFDSFVIFSTNKGLQSLTNCKWFKIGGEPVILIK